MNKSAGTGLALSKPTRGSWPHSEPSIWLGNKALWWRPSQHMDAAPHPTGHLSGPCQPSSVPAALVVALASLGGPHSSHLPQQALKSVFPAPEGPKG